MNIDKRKLKTIARAILVDNGSSPQLLVAAIRDIILADEKTLTRMEAMIDDLVQRQNLINKQVPSEVIQ